MLRERPLTRTFEDLASDIRAVSATAGSPASGTAAASDLPPKYEDLDLEQPPPYDAGLKQNPWLQISSRWSSMSYVWRVKKSNIYFFNWKNIVILFVNSTRRIPFSCQMHTHFRIEKIVNLFWQELIIEFAFSFLNIGLFSNQNYSFKRLPLRLL